MVFVQQSTSDEIIAYFDMTGKGVFCIENKCCCHVDRKLILIRFETARTSFPGVCTVG
jgi:hypothetical protein